MPGNPLVRFDEGRVGRTARCRLLSYSTVKSFFESVDDTGDAVFHQGNVEVDEQPQTFVGQLQPGEKLLFVRVSVKSCEDVNRLVDHGNGLPARDAQSTLFQFVRQRRFVHRFQ